MKPGLPGASSHHYYCFHQHYHHSIPYHWKGRKTSSTHAAEDEHRAGLAEALDPVVVPENSVDSGSVVVAAASVSAAVSAVVAVAVAVGRRSSAIVGNAIPHPSSAVPRARCSS